MSKRRHCSPAFLGPDTAAFCRRPRKRTESLLSTVPCCPGFRAGEGHTPYSLLGAFAYLSVPLPSSPAGGYLSTDFLEALSSSSCWGELSPPDPPQRPQGHSTTKPTGAAGDPHLHSQELPLSRHICSGSLRAEGGLPGTQPERGLQGQRWLSWPFQPANIRHERTLLSPCFFLHKGWGGVFIGQGGG